ncbi:MAG: carboxypeptidase-like regulatory domain-containing protein [Bacteroidales bacterium]
MKLKPVLKLFFATLMLIVVTFPAFGQGRQIRGTIFEADGVTPVPGATVTLKGTSIGSAADLNGVYSITVTGTDPVLVFQFIGYTTQEIPVGDQTVINVVMQEDVFQLGSVVVTALGLSREERSLGYSVSKVDNEALTQSVNSNWLSGMSGKVAGLTFNGANSGPIGSMRVTLRVISHSVMVKMKPFSLLTEFLSGQEQQLHLQAVAILIQDLIFCRLRKWSQRYQSLKILKPLPC